MEMLADIVFFPGGNIKENTLLSYL